MKKAVCLCILIISITIPFIYSNGEDSPVSFTNLSYDYTLVLPDYAYIDFEKFDENKDRVIDIQDKDGQFSAVIACDRMDEKTMELMRDYFNERSSTDEEIFQRYTQYKKSYFAALQDYYKRSFIYSENDEKSTEYNMKIFGEFNISIAEQESDVLLYNIIKSDNTGSVEETHLDILIPFWPNKSVYSINFTMGKGLLNAQVAGKISELLNSICLSGVQVQTEFFQDFAQENAVSAANMGIYAFPGRASKIYGILVNTDSRYVLTYPSTFVPYIQNSIIGKLDYKSFKINYNDYFSISAEPVPESGDAIQNKIDTIKMINAASMKVIEEGTTKGFKNEYRFFKYKIETPEGPAYIQHYFIANNSRLYDVKLNSRFTRPSAEIENEFLKTIDSLVLFPSSSSASEPVKLIKFTNSEEGYTVSYPEGWELSQNLSEDVNYDMFAIKNPDLSGALDILVAEGELESDLSSSEILKYISSKDAADLKKCFKKYNPPYEGRPARFLNISYGIKDGNPYLYRLVNYLDSNNRSRLCGVVDIIRGKKVYSLFISVSEYLTADGKISDAGLQASINSIVGSFGLEDTPEFLARQAAGETRNRKVAFIENYFKESYAQSAHLISASNTGTPGEILVNLDGMPDAGFYRINLDYNDYNKKKIDELGRVLKSDLKSDCEKFLKDIFKTEINVSFQPDKEFLSEKDSSPAGNGFYTAVYTEVSGVSGYFVLEINPMERNIKTVSYKPVESIFESIRKRYSGLDAQFEPVNYTVDSEDKFKLTVFLLSSQDKTIQTQQIKIKRSGTTVTAE